MILDGYCTCGSERDAEQTAEDLLAQMKAAGVGGAVIVPEDREIALHNAAGNERIAKLAAQSDGKLIAACSVNPWHGAEGVRLLSKAVRDGARMLVLVPTVQGFSALDELVDPLLVAAAGYNLPVYIHTGTQASAPTQIGLLARRHARTRFILGHCGSTDYGWDMPAVIKLQLENLWYELSFVRPWAAPQYGALAGESRLIFASGSPRNELAFELRQLDRAWPIGAHRQTFGDNLRNLMSEVTP